MRIALDGRRLLAGARGVSGWTLIEAVLIVLVAVQCARLLWALVTPVGPVGEVRSEAAAAPSDTTLLTAFDPFFRLASSGGPAVVTALNLKLFGVRQDEASGRGSAIIATSSGEQKSIGVGEEIEPGVTLKAVGFDNVTIGRGGRDEQLYMDQGGGAGAAPEPPTPNAPMLPSRTAPSMAPAPLPAAPPPPPPQVSMEMRGSGTGVTGVVVRPQGNADGFRRLGLAPGDVVTAVNGRRIRSAAQARAIPGALASPRGLILQVERDGRVVTLRPGAAR